MKSRIAIVLISVCSFTAAGAVPSVMIAAANGGVATDDHIKFVALLVGTVTVVAGLMAWIDHRIEKKNNAQTRLVMRELSHLRQLLALKLNAPELLGEPSDLTGTDG